MALGFHLIIGLIISLWRTDVPTLFSSQGSSGHKRAPSDASVVSSEDDKVPPAQSTLESVLEKPAEDQAQEKFSDKGLKTSETDEAKEKEVSQAAMNEDLVPASNESKDVGPQQPEEPKENLPAEKIVVPTETVEPQQEALENTPDGEKLVTSGQEIENEKEGEKRNGLDKAEEEKKDIEDDRDRLVEDREDHIEEVAEKSSGLEEQLKDAAEEPESVESAQEEKKEESEKPDELSSQQEVEDNEVEDTTDSVVVNEGLENVESNLKETFAGGDAETGQLRAVEAAAAAAVPAEEEQEETTQQQPEEENDGKTPKETVLPQQVSQPRQDVDVEEPTPTGSTSTVGDAVSKTSKDPAPVTLGKEEEAARVHDNSCQDAVSVQGSETDSESKTEQGSPAMVKPHMEKDSDSGSSSVADNSSLDLNLSISSFLSKSKEGGSVSMQVNLFSLLSQIIAGLVFIWNQGQKIV